MRTVVSRAPLAQNYRLPWELVELDHVTNIDELCALKGWKPILKHVPQKAANYYYNHTPHPLRPPPQKKKREEEMNRKLETISQKLKWWNKKEIALIF